MELRDPSENAAELVMRDEVQGKGGCSAWSRAQEQRKDGFLEQPVGREPIFRCIVLSTVVLADHKKKVEKMNHSKHENKFSQNLPSTKD